MNAPVSGSAGASDSLLLEASEDLTGTGKNPLKKRATANTSNIKIIEAKTDERIFILFFGGHFEGLISIMITSGGLASSRPNTYYSLPKNKKAMAFQLRKQFRRTSYCKATLLSVYSS